MTVNAAMRLDAGQEMRMGALLPDVYVSWVQTQKKARQQHLRVWRLCAPATQYHTKGN